MSISGSSEENANLKSSAMASEIIGGVLTGMIEIVAVVSLASLVFSGGLTEFLPRAIGFSLAGATILVLIVGLTSSHPNIFSSVQDAPAVIMALSAAEIARAMSLNTSQENIFSTVAATIGLTTLITGISFLLLGQLKLGLLIRYLPYPVVGGFLAGTGWILALGGIGVMIDSNLTLTNLYLLMQPELLARWLPGLFFAVIFIILLYRSKHTLIFPGVIVGAMALFYLIAVLLGSSPSELSQAGWLMGPFPNGGLYQPPTWIELKSIEWRQVFGQTGSLITAMLLSVIALLLNTSGLEMVLEKDLDIDRELRSAGYANLVTGLLGSLPGYHMISSSALLHKLGARSRLSLVLASLVIFGALFFGATFLTFLPKLIVGGMLLTLGLDFLTQWVYKMWFQIPKLDWLIIMLILGTIATFGFLEGVAVGTLAAIVMFAVAYSRVTVVKRSILGNVYHSTKTRPHSQRRELVDIGKRIAITELQGFIFFGTASQILDSIKAQFAETQKRCYLILDFSRVSGIDSSVTFGFHKIQQLAKERDTELVFTSLSPYQSQQLERAGILTPSDQEIKVFKNLDEGVEWCENQLLEESGVTPSRTIKEQLSEIINNPAQIDLLMGYLERLVLESGDILIKQGDPADSLYLVESGQVTAQIERPGKKPLRLQTMSGENVVGEVGVYSGLARTASVVVEQPSTVYRLTRTDLNRMERDNPETAIFFHKLMANLMAERVAHMTKVAEELK